MLNFSIKNLEELEEVLATFIHQYAKLPSHNYKVAVFEGYLINGLQIIDNEEEEVAFIQIKEK